MLSQRGEGTKHITLIDPDKQSPEIAAKRALVAVECGTSAIFVGGSTDTGSNIVDATCVAIQEALELAMFASSQHPDADEDQWNVPVILFPGGAHAMSSHADGILFMMLMNLNQTEQVFQNLWEKWFYSTSICCAKKKFN